MASKLPHDAFDLYFKLGANRSYQQLAAHFGVSKKTVVAVAKADDWQGRISRMEKEIARRADEQTVEDLLAMRTRHLKMIQLLQSKALEALKNLPIGTAHQAVLALLKSIEQERLVRGEPTERTAISMEETIRHEYERWLRRSEDLDAS